MSATTRRIDNTAAIVKRLTQPVVDELTDRIDFLHRRIKELEGQQAKQASSMVYCGVWQQGSGYQRGDCVTYDGQLWHCHATTTERPATTEDWQLMQRRSKR